MNSIIIGQYIPGNGFFYKLDPRTKIIAIFFLMISVFMLQTIVQLLIAIGIAVVILLIGRISLFKVVRGLKPIFILLVFTFIFQIALNTEGTVLSTATMHFNLYSIISAVLIFVLWRILLRFGKFKILLFLAFAFALYFNFRYITFQPDFYFFQLTIYEKGVEMSVFVVLRLLIIITLTTVLTLTTKPTDLTQGLERLMHPLKKIGFNSEDFALIISISLRYIPTIFDEAQKIMAAQASRGADFSEGKLKDKLKQIISLLVPMFIIAFMRSEELADAMESRNFVPGEKRTRINILRFSIIDIYTGLFTLACFAGTILVKVML
ncbi:MAG: energy-coupling factor transporter transmembrane protein EcfT [Bacilli bacterium]|nr:energy-coupling factor transporter transmembrane protein EcfT [Bacilli bacterium]MBN2876981.1 energy-coupling factor transporter transmembrane protein EcfT [Bacilli bacterium]